MDKITYLAELAEGLARWVPHRERQDILRYYAEYFEEAGPEREAEVVAELGDPWALSCRLAVEGGYVTYEKAMSWRPRKTRRRFLVGVAVGLAVFGLVFSVGMLTVNVAQAVTRNVIGYNMTNDPVSEWGTVTAWDETELLMEDLQGATGYYFMGGGHVASFSAIDADISLGNVEVVSGDDFTLSIGHGEALLDYMPSWEVTNGVLRLRDNSQWPQVQVNSWEDFVSLFGAGLQPVEVTITVPSDAGLDRISVKTGLGNVLLYGVNAESVDVETGMGNVECYEARNARRVGLSTGMGNVNLVMDEACGGLSVGLKSGKGNVEASLCGFEMDYSYTLESGMGTVTVNGGYQNTKVERRGNQPYQLEANSAMGDVNIWFTFD